MSAGSKRMADRGYRGFETDSPGTGYHRFLRYGHILSSLLRELLEERFLSAVSGHPLTRPQFCFLKIIALNADLHIGEVARSLAVSGAAGTKTIDKLERLGLVERHGCTEDRRRTRVHATAEGRTLVENYELVKASRLWPVLEELGDERRLLLCQLLEEVCVNLLEQEGPFLRKPCLRCAGYYRADCSVLRTQGTCALRPRRSGGTRGDPP